MANAGAIIHIIYDILKVNDNVDKCFNTKFIYDNYINLENKEKIIKIFFKRKTYNYIKTFNCKKTIYSWIYLHINKKEIFWFKKCNKRGYFELKLDLTARLEKERKENNIS